MKKSEKSQRAERLAAMKRESERHDREQIRARLALPMIKRPNFLRVPLAGGGSSL